MEQFNKANKPSKEHIWSVLALYPAITFGFCTCDSELGPLSDVCTHVSLYAQQGVPPGTPSGLANLEHVLKSWIASDLLFKKF